MKRRERFSVVETQKVVYHRFRRNAGQSDTETPLMFTGIQILEPRIFDYIPRGVFSHSITDVYPPGDRERRTHRRSRRFRKVA